MRNCTFGTVSHNSNNSTLPNSRVISFESLLNGLKTSFCLKSAWSASRWGWFSILFTSSWTRMCSASFTTACHSPGTLKSILCSSLSDPPIRVSPYLFVWSFSTCLGVKTQRFVDLCPDTGFSVLVEFVTSSCFSWLTVSRSDLVRPRDSFLHPITSFHVLDNWYWVFVRLVVMSLLLLAISESNSHVQLSL